MYQGDTPWIWQNLLNHRHIIKVEHVLFFLRVDIFLIHSKRRNLLILGRELHLFTLAEKGKKPPTAVIAKNKLDCQAFQALDETA